MVTWILRLTCIIWAGYSLLQYPLVSADKSTRTIYQLKAEIRDVNGTLPNDKANLLAELVDDSIEEFDRNNGYIDDKLKSLSIWGAVAGLFLLILSFLIRRPTKS